MRLFFTPKRVRNIEQPMEPGRSLNIPATALKSYLGECQVYSSVCNYLFRNGQCNNNRACNKFECIWDGHDCDDILPLQAYYIDQRASYHQRFVIYSHARCCKYHMVTKIQC